MPIMDHSDVAHHTASTVLRVSPPVAVIVTALGGIPWQTIVYELTALYLVVQIGYGVWKWRRDVKQERAPKPTVPSDR